MIYDALKCRWVSTRDFYGIVHSGKSQNEVSGIFPFLERKKKTRRDNFAKFNAKECISLETLASLTTVSPFELLLGSSLKAIAWKDIWNATTQTLVWENM